MSAEENKRLAREGVRIWSTGDFDSADEIYAPNYVNHQHHHLNDPRDLHGTEAMKTFATEFREAFPDFHDSIDIQLAEGEMVATRVISSGTHRGTLLGVEPTNEELSWTSINIDRISEGKIVETWTNWDMMGMMQQLGAARMPGESEEASPTKLPKSVLFTQRPRRCGLGMSHPASCIAPAQRGQNCHGEEGLDLLPNQRLDALAVELPPNQLTYGEPRLPQVRCPLLDLVAREDHKLEGLLGPVRGLLGVVLYSYGCRKVVVADDLSGYLV
jgi:steroid delta-isomerase-like uncharacterized protein